MDHRIQELVSTIRGQVFELQSEVEGHRLTRFDHFPFRSRKVQFECYHLELEQYLCANDEMVPNVEARLTILSRMVWVLTSELDGDMIPSRPVMNGVLAAAHDIKGLYQYV
jgi:hypothetical protein